ncbi:MAG: nuclear transport factor 2 family protein [Flavobacteriaceae bacterium]|nr:nuclear transport factor 2 family protein [Flavobacteriaceae bacterium]
MSQSKGILTWHQFIEQRDITILDEFLADDVILYSPVVFTPIKGKFFVKMYLMAAEQIIANENFEYLNSFSKDNDAVLEFKTIIDGITVEGVDMINFNNEGKLKSLKVMVRPLKAMNIVHQKMGEFLEKMK